MTSTPGRLRKLAPVLGIATLLFVLLGFFVYSSLRDPIDFGVFQRPPIYGYWEPRFSPLALWVIPATLLLLGVGLVVVSDERIPAVVGIGAFVACGVALAAAIAVVRGDPIDLVRRIALPGERWVSYASDVPLVFKYGVRGFSAMHPELASEFSYWNTRTHPPGPVLVVYGLFRALGAEHALRISVSVAALGLSGAIGAASIGRSYGGERSGRIAALLFVAAPGPLLYAFTSMDLVFAAIMSFSIAMFIIAIKRQSLAWSISGGFVLGVATQMTFATIFIAVAAAIAFFVQSKPVSRALVQLAGAAIGGLTAILLARLALGIDVLGSYAAVPGSVRPYDPYWILASPAAWLVFAGLPIAAFSLAGVVRRLPNGEFPVLPISLAVIMVVWAMLPTELTRLRPGEVERTWAFLYPVMAGVAAPWVLRWTDRFGRRALLVLSGLIVVSVAQTVVIQSLWETLF